MPSPTTGLRLLISRAELGPAGALLQDGDPKELFSDLVAQEQQWLEQQQRPDEYLKMPAGSSVVRSGWNISRFQGARNWLSDG